MPWIVSGEAAGGGATTDAGDLTTGTLAAARLPGVLANVDTQAELLSAAAAAAASHTHAASDIASGTVGLARGGTNADLSATGGSGHVLKQASAGAAITVGAIAAGDLPTAIDAAKIANGNVSNTEFQYLDGVTSAIQTQLDGKLNDTGDTITGALSFGGSISSAGASTRNIHGNGGTTDLYANVPDTGGFAITEAGIKMAEVKEFTAGYPQLKIYSTGASASAAFLHSGGINYYDVYGGTGGHRFRTNNTANDIINLAYTSPGASTRSIHCGANVNDLKLNINSSGTGGLAANENDVIRWNTGGAQILGSVYGPGADWFFRPQADNVSLAFHGGLNSGGKIMLHGTSGNKAGVVATTPTPITRASNGTWTDVYSLDLGTHRGDFWIYDSLGEGHARLPVNGTSLGSIVDNAGGVTYVDAGWAATGNVAFRISGGALQINVGTAVTASTQFAIEYRGGIY